MLNVWDPGFYIPPPPIIIWRADLSNMEIKKASKITCGRGCMLGDESTVDENQGRLYLEGCVCIILKKGFKFLNE